MTTARKRQVCLDSTSYYHVMSRCVRRGFLFGSDPVSGMNYDHRRDWIVDGLKRLCAVFAIEVGAYAVMTNHFHLVLHIDQARAKAWSADEVMERWLSLHQGHPLVRRAYAKESMSRAAYEAADGLIAEYRDRLFDLGWFMRELKQDIAVRANREDHCTGHFWEARYKSQALLDEKALLTCMAYVDLNPIRAAMAKTPEGSEYTSIQSRIRDSLHPKKADPWLQPFRLPVTNEEANEHALPMYLPDYLELVDWTGRAIRDDKRGAIPNNLPPILERMNLDQKQWMAQIKHFGKWYSRAIGPAHQMRKFASRIGQHWIKGMTSAAAYYAKPPPA